MNVLVTGSSGLIGSALAPELERRGHHVARLVRHSPSAERGEIGWDPEAGRIDAARLAGVDVVVHLAGESLGHVPWTGARQRRIRDSRVEGTRLLVSALIGLERPPAALVCASAIGYYGDRGDEPLDEESPPGSGFLAQVAVAWEAACDAARDAGMRVVLSRNGLVLSRRGGALPPLIRLTQMRLGGPLGDGRQYWSWISLEDVIEILVAAVEEESVEGPLNVVARATPQAEFQATLARLLNRPARLRAPAFALRLALGAMADEMLLASTRAEPARLLEAGYAFVHPDLEEALRAALAERPA